MKKYLALSLVTLGIVTLTACGPAEDESSPSAPFSLPPQDSFVLDFNGINSAQSKAISDALSYYDYSDAPMSKVIQDYSDSAPSHAALDGVGNHAFAGARVLGWSVATALGTAIPIASFQEAFRHKPTSLGDGRWQWAYSVTVLFVRYNAKLIGHLEGEQLQWEMYLSRADGTFTDVNWYSGTHDIGVTAGSWTLRKLIDGSTTETTDVIAIDWQRDTVAGTRNIRYTNLADNGYIENGISTATDYNAYFNIDNQVLPAVINIEWNNINKDGRVKSSNTTAPTHFGHADWNCWQGTDDATPYADVACTP